MLKSDIGFHGNSSTIKPIADT